MTNNRRQMLKDVGRAVTGGFMASAFGYAANETIHVGCIGTGGRAQVLMKALARIPGVAIAAVCDVWDDNLAKGRELAAPGAFSTRDYRAILDRKDIDAVLIGTPNHQHVPMTVAACSAGKDVYVEKPLTHMLAEGPKAIEAQNRSKRIVQVGLQQRSMPQFQKGYELVRSGQLGPIRKVHLTWNRNAARTGYVQYHIDPASVDWQAWLGGARPQAFDPYRFRQWRWFWDFGGGVLADLMVHYIDVAHWYLGSGSSGRRRHHRRQIHGAAMGDSRHRADAAPLSERPGLFRIDVSERAQRRDAGVHDAGSHLVPGPRPARSDSRDQARRRQSQSCGAVGSGQRVDSRERAQGSGFLRQAGWRAAPSGQLARVRAQPQDAQRAGRSRRECGFRRAPGQPGIS